jgi:hypothetical protein
MGLFDFSKTKPAMRDGQGARACGVSATLIRDEMSRAPHGHSPLLPAAPPAFE